MGGGRHPRLPITSRTNLTHFNLRLTLQPPLPSLPNPPLPFLSLQPLCLAAVAFNRAALLMSRLTLAQALFPHSVGGWVVLSTLAACGGEAGGRVV